MIMYSVYYGELVSALLYIVGLLTCVKLGPIRSGRKGMKDLTYY